ncbi:MAG: S-layer homology domain-containing protein, partial [Clostridiaceae bacterium]|nr:S-layer homology domain-containing protein [Clostridiaceae bacterium]
VGENGNRILVNPTFADGVGRLGFNLTGTGISSLAASGAALSLNSPILNLNLSPAALAELASRGYKQISFSFEAVDGNIVITIMADGRRLDNLGGNITAVLPVPNGGRGTVAAAINEDGIMDILKFSSYKNGLLTIPLDGSLVFAPISNAMDFSDTQRHWAEEYIEFVTARNLFQGTGKNQFSPQTGMTRGMIVTVLGRLSGADTGKYDGASFSDVGQGAYYAGYVEWAAKMGIVQGVGQGMFLPDQDVTREQLAVILFNYIKYMGFEIDQGVTDTQGFADGDEISAYAIDAVAAMQRAGIINGKDGRRFDPKGKASRAEVAAMLERLISSIVW